MVARLRVKAETDRSYVACRALCSDERALQDRIRSIRAERRAMRVDAESAVEAALADALRELPKQQRDRILAPYLRADALH
jgi:uncharacterized protein YqfA (UPF0365 family)